MRKSDDGTFLLDVCSDNPPPNPNPYEFSSLNPPAPAPGRPVLNENERSTIDLFLDDVITDQVDLSDEFCSNSNIEGFGAAATTQMWANHLPPQFCGSATLSQQTDYREFANRYLQFGTDTNFAGGVFVPPQNQKSVDEVTSSMLKEIQCLRRQPSGASTVASSPMLSRHKLHDHHAFFPNSQELIPPREQGTKDVSSRGNYGSASLLNNNTRVVTKRQREKLANNGSGNPPRAKRRKSGSNAAAGGEKKRNLTEEEKRSNHIESEQKRRDQISESFNAMVRLVPELRNSSHSKSEKLRLACTWLESMMADNEEIGALLASTEPTV